MTYGARQYTYSPSDARWADFSHATFVSARSSAGSPPPPTCLRSGHEKRVQMMRVTLLLLVAQGDALRRAAIVTGGTRGIGRGIAEALAEAQFDLLVTYNSDSEAAEEAASALRAAHGCTVECVGGDISLTGAATPQTNPNQPQTVLHPHPPLLHQPLATRFSLATTPRSRNRMSLGRSCTTPASMLESPARTPTASKAASPSALATARCSKMARPTSRRCTTTRGCAAPGGKSRPSAHGLPWSCA